MFGLITLFAIGLTSNAIATPSSHGLKLVIDNSTGNYNVQLNGQTWLSSAPSFVTSAGQKRFSTDGQGLKLISVTKENGEDVLGKWTGDNFIYQPGSIPSRIQLSFRVYAHQPMVLFGQTYLDGLNGTSVGDSKLLLDTICTGFPRFQRSKNLQGKLGYIALGGIMSGHTRESFGVWDDNGWENSTIKVVRSGRDSGPLTLFNGKGETILISPFREFMAQSSVYTNESGQATVSWGIIGEAADIPAGFSAWTSIYYSRKGINDLMSNWGKMMRTYYSKGTQYRDSDFANNYIGYWTDNGAYYYYLTEPGKSHEQTILDVKSYADQLQIPYRYVQYDSWWYYKGPNNGVTEWVSMPSVFPHGMEYLYNKTGWPVVAHNRWWSNETVYAKTNGGEYDFVVENKTRRAMPVDQKFWDFLMESSRKWGLITYEQDWLNNEFDALNIVATDIRVGRQWLRQMGEGARKSGITIQYCMATARHVLQSLEIPVVTQTRVTGDYHPGKMQWRIGITAMFASAVGLAPFKDNFWTTTHQPGNIYNGTEPYPELNSLVSTLSTGPVGPSDMIGASNRDIIMRTCNSDGLILKPSKPITTIDKMIYQTAFNAYEGEVMTTHSEISNMFFGIILGASFRSVKKQEIGPNDAGFGKDYPSSVVYDRNMSEVKPFSDTNKLILSNCGVMDGEFCVFYTSPVLTLGGKALILMGESSKWVPMSPKRLSSISQQSGAVRINLLGGAREQVTFSYSLGGKLNHVKCVLSASGEAGLVIKSDSNECK